MAEPGLTAIGSGRCYGFVIGGAAAVVARGRLARLGLGPEHRPRRSRRRRRPRSRPSRAAGCSSCSACLADSSFAFVTGCQMAHVTCLAAARHVRLRRAGYDLPQRGLAGRAAAPCRRRRQAPRDHHARAPAARDRRVPGGRPAGRQRGPDGDRRTRGRARRVDADDRLRPGGRGEHRRVRRSRDDRRACGARPAPGCTSTARSGSGPRRARPWRTSCAGTSGADSWATDAHKWLNVPYDCGIAICAHPDDHAAAMEYAAPYLAVSESRRRARPDGLQPRVLAPRAGRSGVGGDPRARPRRGRRRSSTAAARTPVRSPKGSRRCRAARSSTTSSSTRCCSGSRTTSGRRRSSPPCSGGRGVDEPDHLGRAVGDPHLRLGWRTNEHDVERTVAAFARATVGARRRPPVSRPRARRSR